MNSSNKLPIFLEIFIPTNFKPKLFDIWQLFFTISNNYQWTIQANRYLILINIEIELFLSRLGNTESSNNWIMAY